MSAYVGDKFILEVEEIFKSDQKDESGEYKKLYRMKGFKSLVFDEDGIKLLQPYVDRHDEGYLEGCHDVRDYYEKKNSNTDTNPTAIVTD